MGHFYAFFALVLVIYNANAEEPFMCKECMYLSSNGVSVWGDIDCRDNPVAAKSVPCDIEACTLLSISLTATDEHGNVTELQYFERNCTEQHLLDSYEHDVIGTCMSYADLPKTVKDDLDVEKDENEDIQGTFCICNKTLNCNSRLQISKMKEYENISSDDEAIECSECHHVSVSGITFGGDIDCRDNPSAVQTNWCPLKVCGLSSWSYRTPNDDKELEVSVIARGCSGEENLEMFEDPDTNSCGDASYMPTEFVESLNITDNYTDFMGTFCSCDSAHMCNQRLNIVPPPKTEFIQKEEEVVCKSCYYVSVYGISLDGNIGCRNDPSSQDDMQCASGSCAFYSFSYTNPFMAEVQVFWRGCADPDNMALLGKEGKTKSVEELAKEGDEMMLKGDEMMKEGDEMMKDGDVMMEKDKYEMKKHGEEMRKHGEDMKKHGKHMKHTMCVDGRNVSKDFIKTLDIQDEVYTDFQGTFCFCKGDYCNMQRLSVALRPKPRHHKMTKKDYTKPPAPVKTTYPKKSTKYAEKVTTDAAESTGSTKKAVGDLRAADSSAPEVVSLSRYVSIVLSVAAVYVLH